MNSMPPLEIVYQALRALYHDPEPASKEKASMWLGELQKSVFAWKVADDLLQHKADMESCYFGAQTIRTKIQFAFHELPKDAHASLRDSMLNHLSQVNEHTNTVIVTQLCVGFADFILQMSSWSTPVEDMLQKFGPSSAANTPHLWPLLEILVALPEEVGSRTLRLGANRREDVLKYFSSTSKNVLSLLDSCWGIQSTDRLLHVRVLRCFASWAKAQVIPIEALTSCQTLNHAFNVLASHESSPLLHEAAADALCALVNFIGDWDHHRGGIALTDTVFSYRSLENSLLVSVKRLEEPYHYSVAEEDMEKSLNYCRVFTELAEALLNRFIETPSTNGSGQTADVMQLLELVLTCVGHHDYEVGWATNFVAEVTFGLWYKLSEELYQANDDSHSARFKPYIERLIGAIGRHCQMEPDHEGILPDDDEFADFRTRASELIKDVVFIVGSEAVFKHAFVCLQGHNLSWEVTEASLFLMQTVAKNIIPDEEVVVPHVMQAILTLPNTVHPAVRYTVLQLIGELCEWIEKHPTILESVLDSLVQSLPDAQLAPIASASLSSICSSCRDHLSQPPHLHKLLHVIEVLGSLPLTTDAATGLLQGVAQVVSRLSGDSLKAAVDNVVGVHLQPLKAIAMSREPTSHGHDNPVYWLDRLASVFRHLVIHVDPGEQHPCQKIVLEDTWPILAQVCDKYVADKKIMERSCRCLRFAIRCLGSHAIMLLQPLSVQLVQWYCKHQHSCFLYLGSVLVDEYGGQDPSSPTGPASMLMEMLPPTLVPAFRLLQDPVALPHHSDTIDDLFRFCLRFLQRCPSHFLQFPGLSSIIQCGLQAAIVDHRDANASVMKFFSELIQCARAKEEKLDSNLRVLVQKSLVEEQGAQIVGRLMSAALFSLSTSCLPDVADVFMELMMVNKEGTRKWLEHTLNALSTQTTTTCSATPRQMTDFAHNFLKCRNAKELSRVLKEFTRLYR